VKSRGHLSAVRKDSDLAGYPSLLRPHSILTKQIVIAFLCGRKNGDDGVSLFFCALRCAARGPSAEWKDLFFSFSARLKSGPDTCVAWGTQYDQDALGCRRITQQEKIARLVSPPTGLATFFPSLPRAYAPGLDCFAPPALDRCWFWRFRVLKLLIP